MKEEIKTFKDLNSSSKIYVYYKKMLSYCFKFRKYTKSKKAKNGRIMLLPKCEVFDSKKSRLIKEKEASELLTSLG